MEEFIYTKDALQGSNVRSAVDSWRAARRVIATSHSDEGGERRGRRKG